MELTRLIEEAYPHYHLLPVGKDSKVSLGKWKDRVFEIRELLYHATRGANLAARVGMTPSGVQVLVIDRDAHDMESWKAIRRHGIAQRSNMVTVTASGNAHYWFGLEKSVEDLRTRIRMLIEGKTLPVDVKATGYVLMPGSKIGGKEYRFASDKKAFKKPEDLNPLPESFLALLMEAEEKAVTKATTVNVKNNNTVTKLTTNIESVRRYIRKIVAVSGQGGHNAAYRAACRLADAGLCEADVFAELIEWNETNTLPPFTLKELEHKARDATSRKRR